MAIIGFIGLGHMGRPMAENLAAKGHDVRGFDAVAAAAPKGVTLADDPAEAAADADVVITMLPAGPQSHAVWLEHALIDAMPAKALAIDCSTIDVSTARALHAAAAERGIDFLDAPVSGGTAGAAAGTLTFMIGGAPGAVERGRPILAGMGQNLIDCGGPGLGQAAKICNNLMLAIQMLSVAEGFRLAESLALAPEALFAVSSKGSGQCWSLTSYAPVPGLVPASPANRDFQPGFAAAMMLKDLRLAEAAATAAGQPIPAGNLVAGLYQDMIDDGEGGLDFSAIIRRIIAKSV